MNDISPLPNARSDQRLSRANCGRWFVLCIVSLIATVTTATSWARQSTAETESAELAPISENLVSIGFDQQVKLGMWTTFHFRGQESATKFEITVRDGDDAPVTYTGSLTTVGAGDSKRQHAFCRFGRGFGGAKIKLMDASDQVTLEESIVVGEGGIELNASTQQMTVVFEPTADVIGDAIVAGTVVEIEDKPPIVVSTDETNQLPSQWFCYQGVQTFVLVANDVEKINQVQPSQWDALERWVENGGRLILSVSPGAVELVSEGGCLERFLPGKVVGVSEMKSSSQLESFASVSSQQLLAKDERLKLIELTDVTGKIELTQNKVPLIVNQGLGAGEISFLAIELNSTKLTEWKGFSSLLNRFVSVDAVTEQKSDNSRTSRVTHYGYEDMVGQLRVPLDQYSNVKFVAFTWVAVLIGLYILLIGPGDYFLLRKVLGKMELTWVTFSLISLAFCGLALWAASWTKPSEVQINQLEIIDVDATTGTTRGNVWANLYTPSTERLNIELDEDNKFGFEIQSDMLSWQGLPGDGLGGLSSNSRTGLVRQSYLNQINVDEDSQVESKLTNVPIQVSSSKALYAQWWAPSPDVVSNLKASRFNVGLEGTFKNPLNVELKNCRVMFENWVYLIDRRVKVGDIVSIKEMSQKNTKAYLTRRNKKNREDVDERAQNSPWDPTATNIRRIANMMMFYEAAGGASYTGLSHDFQPHIDLSRHLSMGRAIVVGEIDGRLNHGTHLKINGESATENYDDEVTIVRLIVPVKPAKKKSTSNP